MVLQQPVQLGNDNLVCAPCCCGWLEDSSQEDRIACSLQAAPRVVIKVLASLKVVCNSCKKQTTAEQFDLHKNSKCTAHYLVTSPTVDDILFKPSTAPTDPVERRIAGNVVRRLLAESDSNTIQIPTHGPVRTNII